jgi:hypothetical protein
MAGPLSPFCDDLEDALRYAVALTKPLTASTKPSALDGDAAWRWANGMVRAACRSAGLDPATVVADSEAAYLVEEAERSLTSGRMLQSHSGLAEGVLGLAKSLLSAGYDITGKRDGKDKRPGQLFVMRNTLIGNGISKLGAASARSRQLADNGTTVPPPDAPDPTFDDGCDL